MVRTQVQFSEDQIHALRRLSAERKQSMSDLVRERVDMFLKEQKRRSVVERALNARTFGSGLSDLGENHDKYFADAIEDRDQA